MRNSGPEICTLGFSGRTGRIAQLSGGPVPPRELLEGQQMGVSENSILNFLLVQETGAGQEAPILKR
jgi:hypothetical protein